MTIDQIKSILQAVLSAIGGFVLAKGWVTAETWAWIVGGILTVGPTIWSWISTRPQNIAAAAQNIQGVNVQVTQSAPAGVATAVANAKAAS